MSYDDFHFSRALNKNGMNTLRANDTKFFWSYHIKNYVYDKPQNTMKTDDLRTHTHNTE